MTNSSVRVLVTGRINNGVYERANGDEYIPVGSLTPPEPRTLLADRGPASADLSVPTISGYSKLRLTWTAIIASNSKLSIMEIAGFQFSFASAPHNGDLSSVGIQAAGGGLDAWLAGSQVLNMEFHIDKTTGDLKAYSNGSLIDEVSGTGPVTGTGDIMRYTQLTTHGTEAALIADFRLYGVN